MTRGYLVPPIVLLLAKDPLVSKYNLSSLRVINCGAAPLGDQVQMECSKRIGVIIKQGYGLTETSPTTHTFHDGRELFKSASVGTLVANTEAMVIDTESGKPLGRNEKGELWMRGPQIMLGYLNNKSATDATVDADGWLHSGDVAYIDEDDCFYIVDRTKELIKYKGSQVAPAELEAILLAHPDLADAAVIGMPDEYAGELPLACVVLKKGHAALAEDIIKFVNSKVSHTKHVRLLEFVEAIPKSPSGKILRRELREHFKNRRPSKL